MLTVAVINHDVVRTIVDITISGDAAAEFAVTGGNCARGMQLDGGDRCTLEVTFAPTTSGTRTARLTVLTTPGAPADSLNLRGGFHKALSIPSPTLQTQTTKTN
jgi:hypothetical protein